MPTIAGPVESIALSLAAVAAAVLVATALYGLLRHLGRHSELARDLVRRAYRPTQLAAALAALQVTMHLTMTGSWRAPILKILLLGTIAASAWLGTALLLVLEETALDRFRVDVSDNLVARRVHTQISLVRRITLAAIFVLTLGTMLLTFPQARAAGAGVFASAGVIGVVTALAAQSTLGNIFAGLHLAFGDALRLDDVVVVEGEWGWIEEITLSYVVVKIWDERRLILPTSYFTTSPFQNWTKTSSPLLGTVEVDVDWSVPLDEMRAELTRIVEASALWDKRVSVLQVTEATGGMIRVRALVSAADSPTAWDLRCLVRERLVAWVQDRHPHVRPRLRADLGGGAEPVPRWTQQPHPVATTRPREPHEAVAALDAPS